MKRKIALLICITLTLAGTMGCNKTTTVNSTNETTSEMVEISSIEESTTEESITKEPDIDGNEIAKLLLAVEGLNTEPIDILDELYSTDTNNNSGLSGDNINLFINPINRNTGICTVNGNTYEWSGFSDRCEILEEVETRVTDVETAKDCFVDVINYIRKNGFITDTWLKSYLWSSNSYMLTVENNKETLYYASNNGNNKGIFIRYTDEQARSVYKIYLDGCWDIGEGEVFKKVTYITYIPEVLYECVCDSVNGDLYDKSYQHMEKVDGYWELTMLSTYYETAEKIITGPNANYHIRSYLNDSYEWETPVEIGIFSADGKNDLLRFNQYSSENGASITIPLAAYTGYQCVRLTTDSVSMIDDDVHTIIEYDGNSYTYTGPGELVLSNGQVLASEGDYIYNFNEDDVSETLLGVGDYIEGLDYHGCDVLISDDGGYWGTMSINIASDNPVNNINIIQNFLSENGINCTYDFNAAVNDLVTGKVKVDKSSVRAWNVNGYTLDSLENLNNAIDVRIAEFADYEAMHNEKKVDNMVVDLTTMAYQLSDYSFTVPSIESNAATFDSEGINIGEITVNIDDTTLFEEGGKYSVVVGYVSAVGDYYIPQLYSSFDTDERIYTEYMGGNSFTITQTFDELAHQQGLYSGMYRLVAWIVNEQGIRVTDFAPIEFELGEDTTYSFEGGSCTVSLDGNYAVAIFQ